MTRIRFYCMERSGVLAHHQGGHLRLGDDESIQEAITRRLARDTSRAVLQVEPHSVIQAGKTTILKLHTAVGEAEPGRVRVDGYCLVSVHLPN